MWPPHVSHGCCEGISVDRLFQFQPAVIWICRVFLFSCPRPTLMTRFVLYRLFDLLFCHLYFYLWFRPTDCLSWVPSVFRITCPVCYSGEIKTNIHCLLIHCSLCFDTLLLAESSVADVIWSDSQHIRRSSVRDYLLRDYTSPFSQSLASWSLFPP